MSMLFDWFIYIQILFFCFVLFNFIYEGFVLDYVSIQSLKQVFNLLLTVFVGGVVLIVLS